MERCGSSEGVCNLVVNRSYGYSYRMKKAGLLLLLATSSLMNVYTQTAQELAELWDKEHVTNKFPSNVRHRDLQNYLEGLKKLGVKVEEVGRSYANREIYQIEWGKGGKRVFLWSQMHGDEPTATSALIDMFTVLQKNRDKDWVKKIESEMTIRAVPMLNPDGAELYVRRNLQGIDINRDAEALVTPEARLLKRLRDEWQPELGFNLHNQNELTTAGLGSKQAAISFLAVYGDAPKTEGDGHLRNKRIITLMSEALRQFIPGHLGRYADGYTPTAFGDSFSAWGTPVILIETGALHGKDEMFLVRMNFVAFLTALRSYADGSNNTADPVRYFELPNNASGSLFNFIFRGASVVDRSDASVTVADIALNLERRRAEFPTPAKVRQVGDLAAYYGLEEYDASGFFVTGRMEPIKPGNMGELLFYKKDRKVDWTAPDLEKQYEPDAILSFGKWIKGAGVVPKKN
jgi:hypothetical protein